MWALDEGRLERAFSVVERGVEGGAFAGAVAAVGCGNALVVRAFGHAALQPARVPMRPDTLFDLASLTKVVGTTPAVLRLVEDGAFSLDAPVADLLPEFADRRVTVRHLLTHTSGLPAWAPLYLDHRGLPAYLRAIGGMPLERPPGERVVYSDLGFILLGAIVERVAGESLPDYCRKAVFAPLGMDATGWLPAAPRERIAATEAGNRTEMDMAGARAAEFGHWRQEILWGEVNDGNAHYGLGGVAGHAGLFGTVADLAAYARAWLRRGFPILSPPTVQLATRNLTAGLGGARGLGWQKPPEEPLPARPHSCGELLSAAAYGHTGFTGTSLWIDPEKELFIILLTNRLHPVPERKGPDLLALRPAFHNAVVAACIVRRAERATWGGA